MVRRGDMLDTPDILDVLAIELLGVVPEDERVIVASNQGIPIVTEDNSLAGQAFSNIARRLNGEEVPFMALEESDGFFGRLTRLMRSGGDS
jgi:septum site-determining protein MinD